MQNAPLYGSLGNIILLVSKRPHQSATDTHVRGLSESMSEVSPCSRSPKSKVRRTLVCRSLLFVVQNFKIFSSSKNCSRCSSYQRKTIHRRGLQCQTSNNESQCQNESDGKHVRTDQTCNYIYFQFGSL